MFSKLKFHVKSNAREPVQLMVCDEWYRLHKCQDKTINCFDKINQQSCTFPRYGSPCLKYPRFSSMIFRVECLSVNVKPGPWYWLDTTTPCEFYKKKTTFFFTYCGFVYFQSISWNLWKLNFNDAYIDKHLCTSKLRFYTCSSSINLLYTGLLLLFFT